MLSVHDQRADVAQARVPCRFRGDLQHARGDVRREDAAVGADALGRRQGRISRARPNVEYPTASVDLGEVEHHLRGRSEDLGPYGRPTAPFRRRLPGAPRATVLSLRNLLCHHLPLRQEPGSTSSRCLSPRTRSVAAQRQASPAAGSRSDAGAKAGGRQVPGRADGYPSGPPTDPDVRNARIRFLRQSISYPCVLSSGGVVTRFVSAKSLSCIVPTGTLCSTSPSLPWVAWASLPHLHWYYTTLRLPPCPSQVASLVARFPIPCVLLLFVVSP